MGLELVTEAMWTVPLAGVRVTSVMATGPFFGHATVPMRIRAAFALLTTVAMAPALPAPPGPELATAALAGAIVSEALIGATLGFALQLIFTAFAPLGEVLSVQGGLGAANILDPTSGASTMVLGVLLQSLAVVVFLAIDGHHDVLRGLAASFERMPIGAGALSAGFFGTISSLVGVLFDVTTRLAAPVIIVMFVANVGVGILGRAIPQLNLIVLQLPANVAIILLILGLSAGPFSDVIAGTLEGATDRVFVSLLGRSG